MGEYEEIVRYTLLMPESLRRQAKARAASEGRSLADVIRSLLRRWLSGEVRNDKGETR